MSRRRRRRVWRTAVDGAARPAGCAMPPSPGSNLHPLLRGPHQSEPGAAAAPCGNQVDLRPWLSKWRTGCSTERLHESCAAPTGRAAILTPGNGPSPAGGLLEPAACWLHELPELLPPRPRPDKHADLQLPPRAARHPTATPATPWKPSTNSPGRPSTGAAWPSEQLRPWTWPRAGHERPRRAAGSGAMVKVRLDAGVRPEGLASARGYGSSTSTATHST